MRTPHHASRRHGHRVNMAASARTSTGAQTRSRTFGGCATCRSRHMKCDERRPGCAMCSYSGLVCGGYEKRIFFDFEGSVATDCVRFRRPLLTEAEREHMSEWLTSKVSPRAVTNQLCEIDDECERRASSQEVVVQRGPFGAFRTSVPDTAETLPSHETIALSDNDVELLLDRPWTPETQHQIQDFVDLRPQGLSSSPPYMWSTNDGELRIEQMYEDMVTSEPHFEQPLLMATTSSEYWSFASACGFRTEPSSAPEHLITSQAVDSHVPHDAVFLVKHYSTQLLSLLTPFRVRYPVFTLAS
ncbi:hypothetical protein BKA63DRAFT_95181 [Paraphoma chrysanthemicola]|nr:hypothetical protein BKA63DRAFT_95181 [Paraphoma chrysanthemicola]